MKLVPVEFMGHEGEPVTVVINNVMYVRRHRCNRPENGPTQTAQAELVMVNGSTVPVQESYDEVCGALRKALSRTEIGATV